MFQNYLTKRSLGLLPMSGAQGRSPLQEEAILDFILSDDDDDDDDAYDSDNTNMPKPVVVAMMNARTEILAKKNQLMEQMMEREEACSVERVIEILNDLPGVRMWSPFYCAALDYLLADARNRQGFVAFSSVEDKISYLEHMMAKKA